MKLKPRKILRSINTWICLVSFSFRKYFFGFESANQFIQRVDKVSLQLILKRNGATIGKDCDIETGLTFHNCNNYLNLIVGNNCNIGKNCFFDLRDKIVIGNNVVISMQCTFITHQDIGKSSLSKTFIKTQSPIIINDNVYIGVNSTILKEIIVGETSIIAAGSVVINNVKENTIVGGVPARKIKDIN